MMKWAGRVIGTILIVAAIIQWITYDYPDVNPFSIGAGFAPGIFGQVVNWLLIAVLAGLGWGFFTGFRFTLKSEKE